MKNKEAITEADVDYTLIEKYPLTDPQVKLLLRIYDHPKHVVDYFRPLHALLNHGLVRPRQVGGSRLGSGTVYEVSDLGQLVAVAHIYKAATSA